MPFDVQEAAANLNKGFARASHAVVSISSPQGMTQAPAQDLRFRIETINIPGRQINTFEFKPYGPAYRIGYAEQHGEVSINVLLSPDFSEKLFFQRWQDLIVGYARGIDNLVAGTFDIGYYNKYISNVDIFQYDKLGDLVYSCKLVEAWPVGISDLPADWSSDTLHRLQVTFVYRYFKDESPGFYNETMQDLAENYQDGVVEPVSTNISGNPSPTPLGTTPALPQQDTLLV